MMTGLKHGKEGDVAWLIIISLSWLTHGGNL